MDDCRYQTGHRPEYKSRAERQIGATEIIQNHDHPFCHIPQFSGIDDEAGIRMAGDLARLGIKARVSQIVFGRDNKRYSARIVHNDERGDVFSPVRRLAVVGSQGWAVHDCGRIDEVAEAGNVSNAVFEKRNLAAFGRSAVRALHDIRVLILGGGGLGSAMGYMLTHLGVTHINILDRDRIDGSNINRQYFVDTPRSAVGRMKASFLARAMRRFNRRGSYHYVNGNIYDEACGPTAIKDANVVICTMDSQSARDESAVLCARYGKPLLNVANAIYLDNAGRLASAFAVAQWFFPRDPGYPCLRCQGVINPDTVNQELMSERLKAMRQKAGYVVGTPDSPAPQVIPINSIAAGIASWELVMWLSGIRKPSPFVHNDVMAHRIMHLRPSAKPDCTVCGDTPASCLVTGDADLAMLGNTPDPAFPVVSPLLKDFSGYSDQCGINDVRKVKVII